MRKPWSINMIVITGGAYQGKRQFAIDNLGIDEDAVYIATGNEDKLELSKHSVIYGLEDWIHSAIKQGLNPVDEIKEILPSMRDCVIICDDISCGVVPIDATERQWREAVGRCMVMLSRNADEVYRVFCGLGTRLK